MNIDVIKKAYIFQGITDNELDGMLKCFSSRVKYYKKGEYIYCAGTPITSLGLVVNGSIIVEYNDLWGNHSVLDCVTAGGIFAENYALSYGEILMVDIVANEESEILFLDTSTVLATCHHACSCHQKFIRNLLALAAAKSLNLSRHIIHISSKNIRGRVLSYLSLCASSNSNYEFDIIYDRQQLADYLCVDRSALSAELSKMKKEGLLDFKKNHFILNVK